MARSKACPVCGVRVKIVNLDRHLQSVHPHAEVAAPLSAEERAAVDAERGRNAPRLSRRERRAYLAVLAILLAVAVLVAVLPAILPSPAEGEAPDFTLATTDGRTVRLSTFEGQVVLLNFMDVDCPHCQRETTQVLVPLYDAYGDRVVFLSVSVGFVGDSDTAEDVRAFMDAYGAAWTFLLDDGTVYPRYGVTGTPTTFVVDGGGRIVHRHVGVGTFTGLADVLDGVLG